MLDGSVPVAASVSGVGAPDDARMSSQARLRYAVSVVLVLLAVLACVPVWTGGVALTFATQCMILFVFAQSFALLLGEAGLLSFGHAVYLGLGAFATAHALNFAGAQGWPLPTPLVPLVGALAGVAGGATLGWFASRRGGIAFAMITLGTGELLATGATAWPALFGGEGGIATDRTYGWSPIDLGSPRHVYVLIAIWALASVAAMRAFARTPLGLAANAVREQPMRAAFVGFDVRRVRYRTSIVSAGFAGVAGALLTLATEQVSADAFSLARSGAVLVAVVLGGASGWGGPLAGTLLYVGCSVVLALYTRAWPFYLGLMFIGVVSFAPRGIVGLPQTLRAWPSPRRCAGALVIAAGLVLGIEMLYRLTLASSDGTTLAAFGLRIDATAAGSWIAAAACVLAGLALGWARLGRARRRVGDVRVDS
ncbi:branched-chain amino acid ABC transporter permease [Pararobbsia silviterrae]|uniref:Branched-chain amino acid ABC transporter permease n=2 Tax=Pararobbsia silviterrae TaxID=1792498 RepID=A0A494XNP4_9BURK|nr:branched-chain amino acid ABC transporter permease [Pararobbsia silviterrae]